MDAKEWRVGTAAECLGSTPEESAHVELKVALGSKQGDLRNRKRLSQVKLAKRLNGLPPAIPEAGHFGPSVQELVPSRGSEQSQPVGRLRHLRYYSVHFSALSNGHEDHPPSFPAGVFSGWNFSSKSHV